MLCRLVCSICMGIVRLWLVISVILDCSGNMCVICLIMLFLLMMGELFWMFCCEFCLIMIFCVNGLFVLYWILIGVDCVVMCWCSLSIVCRCVFFCVSMVVWLVCVDSCRLCLCRLLFLWCSVVLVMVRLVVFMNRLCGMSVVCCSG